MFAVPGIAKGLTPWWGLPWGEHGVGPFDEPLWVGGCCCGGPYVVVPALEDSTPDLRQGVVAVCRWGGEVVIGGAEAGGAVACFHCSGWFVSAGWSLSAGARCRCVVPRRVTLLLVLCVRAWPHSLGGIRTCWPWACWRARQEARSTMASWRPLPGVARS